MREVARPAGSGPVAAHEWEPSSDASSLGPWRDERSPSKRPETGRPPRPRRQQDGRRRLVGIDLGITSAHTVRALRGDGGRVCRVGRSRRWRVLSRWKAALARAPAGTLLEVVMEPTGPAWLPIAVFFCARGHTVYRVSSAKAHDLRRVLSRYAKSNGIDADTLARLPLVDPAGLHPLELPDTARAALDRQVRASDRLTRQAATHKRRIKDLVQQLLPASPLTGELGQADLAVLERWADPHALVAAGRAGCSGCWPPHRPVSRAPTGPPNGWPPPMLRWSCMATTPPSPGRIWPPRSPPRSGCCAPPRPSWPPTPPSGRPATSGSTRPAWPAACPAWPPSAGRPWSLPWDRPAGSPPPASSGASPAWPQGIRDRPERPQGPADHQGRQQAAADHPGPRRRPRPPPRPPAGPHLLTCRWSNAARTTSARSAWSPPTWPSGWTVMNRGTALCGLRHRRHPGHRRPGQSHHRRALDRA